MNYYLNKSKKKKKDLGKELTETGGKVYVNTRQPVGLKNQHQIQSFQPIEMSWEEQGGLGLGVIQTATRHLT